MNRVLLLVTLLGLGSCGGEPAGSKEASADPFAGLTSGWNHILAGGETLCSRGTPYSFWFHPGDPRRLSIYFQGGGACWRPDLCAPDRRALYDPVVDSADDPGSPKWNGIFDLANPENPLAGYTTLYIPYCTADAHVGDTVEVYDVPAAGGKPAESVSIHHVGAVNAAAALAWVYRRITDPSTVFVSGESAGAIGSSFHALAVATHYPNARVVQLGDAGGGLRTPEISRILQTWNTPSVTPDLPEYRDPSTTDLQTFYEAGPVHAHNLRMAQFNTAADSHQIFWLKLAGVDTVQFLKLLDENLAEIHRATPSFRSYVAPGNVHGILFRPSLYTTEVDGVRLVDWIRDLADGKDVTDVTCEEACR